MLNTLFAFPTQEQEASKGTRREQKNLTRRKIGKAGDKKVFRKEGDNKQIRGGKDREENQQTIKKFSGNKERTKKSEEENARRKIGKAGNKKVSRVV